MRIKLCGITSREEARLAEQSGADAVGFLVGLSYPSQDQVSIEKAAELVKELPPFLSSVLVTHSGDATWIADAAGRIRCTTIQLHGPIDPGNVARLRSEVPHCKLIRAVHVEGPDAVDRAAAVAESCDAILLDTKTATRIGGTGRTHDWDISRRVVEAMARNGKPVILAGGLNPGNVARAIEIVRPFAVDVNSGVERPDGTKDPVLVESFVRNARGSLQAPIAAEAASASAVAADPFPARRTEDPRELPAGRKSAPHVGPSR